MMGFYRKAFIVLNIFTIALILVYISTYVDRIVPEKACSYGKNSVSKFLHNLFGQKYRKYLVYLCDDSKRCGEWTERLQGIVMSYLLAKLTKRKFGVLSNNPVRLEKLMEPVLVDWVFDERKVIQGSCAVYDFLSDPHFLTHDLKSVDLEEKFQEDVVYIRAGKFTWTSVNSNPKYQGATEHIANGTATAFYQLIHDILRLNTRMLYQFIVYKNQFKPKALDKLICAVVEGSNGRLDNQDTEALWQFLDKQKGDHHTKIVVSSTDSKLLDLAIIRYTDQFMSMPGIISHFDNTDELRYRILDNMRQIILDFYTLAQCDTLIMTCGSELGLLVAFTRFVDTGMFYLHGGKVGQTTLANLGTDHQEGKCSAK